ncbi:MAG: hypothetical protein AAGE43_14695 [Pseudomonadota bacterium]
MRHYSWQHRAMDVFHTLAEVAVAIAGFSSLAIVFRGQRSGWQSQAYVSLAFALCWSIGSVFLALLPIILGEFGLDLAKAARVGLFVLSAYMLLIGIGLMIVRWRIAAAGGGAMGMNPALTAFFLLIVLGASAAATGLLPGPVHGWLAVSIALLMAHATAELGLLVVGTGTNQEDPG